MMKCSEWHSAHESSIYTRMARARCWPVTSAIPRIHPSDGPSHTIMLSNKIVPFLSRTPNTTDSIHASRWPHPSPGFLLAGHKSRSQWESGDSQQFCAMERSGTLFPRISRSPAARLGPPGVGPGPRPADESQDLFWQLAARRAGGSSQQHASAKKVNLNRLQQQQQCCVSTRYNLESAGAGRPAASPVMGQQFRLQLIQFIWLEYIPISVNAFFTMTEIWLLLLCLILISLIWTSRKTVYVTISVISN